MTVGPLPTLPLLAGLPNGPMGASRRGVAGGAGAGRDGRRLAAHPAAGGVHHGRRSPAAPPGDPVPAEPSWSLVLGAAVLAGPVAGLVLGLLGLDVRRPLGAGRLSEIGPVPWQVALVATGVIAVSASIGAAAARGFRPPLTAQDTRNAPANGRRGVPG